VDPSNSRKFVRHSLKQHSISFGRHLVFGTRERSGSGPPQTCWNLIYHYAANIVRATPISVDV
jgi:hypothetical protein